MRSGEWPAPAVEAADALRRLGGEVFAGGVGDVDTELVRVAVAPGRVNLIGGHTDYNDGFVLPVAVDRFVSCAYQPTGDGQTGTASGSMMFHSPYFEDTFEIELEGLAGIRLDRNVFEELTGDERTRWRRYVTGVVLEMDEAGFPLPPGLGVVSGDIPIGSGLSSSAALEAALFTALAPAEAATPDTALLCQRAENRWAGVPCGIMDQFASLMAKEGHALFLDCRDLRYRNVALPEGVTVTVVDSGVHRELADGEYRKRRQEVETALGILRKVVGPIPALRDLSPGQFEAVEDILPEPLRSRVEHVVCAIARVQDGITRLALGEVERFGELMVQCHRSLADLYEVSVPELDAIVDSALDVDGVLGARLTGAGFGGCCVLLHREGCEEEIGRGVGVAFESRFGVLPSFHHLQTADGAHLVNVRT